MHNHNIDDREAEVMCPDCEGGAISTRWVEQRFQYGKEGNAVELLANIPVMQCKSCGFEFSDDRAEAARDAAIRKHLNLRTPAEIVALREKYGLSRAQFSEKTGIGSASLARWESGQLIQNVANDRYLYLLEDERNFQRILALGGSASPAPALRDVTTVESIDSSRCCRFRALRDEARVRVRAATFRLRTMKGR